MYLSRHPTSYPTRYQEIAARLEQELRHHYRAATTFRLNNSWPRVLKSTAIPCAGRSISWLNAAGSSVVRGWRAGADAPNRLSAQCPGALQPESARSGQPPDQRKLLSVLRPASSHVAEAFGIDEGDNVIHLRTLRRVNGVALCLIDHYFTDLRFWPALQTFTRGSLHDFLRQRLDVELTRARTKISARRAQLKRAIFSGSPTWRRRCA